MFGRGVARRDPRHLEGRALREQVRLEPGAQRGLRGVGAPVSSQAGASERFECATCKIFRHRDKLSEHNAVRYAANGLSHHRQAMATDARLKIAIIDDSSIARAFVRAALGKAYDYVEIESVLDARVTIEREKPGLILMDVRMPGVAGHRLTELLQRSTMRHRCPILLFSDTPEPQLSALADACGAAGYVRKTQDFTELRRAVELHTGASSASPKAPRSA